ncbi:uncharacterized protein LOC123037241 [Drosophila rhopaloa]|uniref:Uncharacterized protein n=1 Tax=Drosophila rhopaloa TaxID=1041015 RepID=A0ABM5J2J0_DRORH|nr:uncharacterized protein LOC123037240 [Drosophila rhopaloa]XP_044313037.1 uncharacterized protein LOC123037241 [Drosophila rhopaloa]
MASSSNQNDFEKIMECITVAEVERIHTLSNSLEKTMLDPVALKLFRGFLESKCLTCIQCLDIHEKCAQFLAEKHPLYDSSELNILSNLGLLSHLKQRLAYRLDDGDPTSISLCLKNIKLQCRNEIEDYFFDFKASVSKKVGRVPK